MPPSQSSNNLTHMAIAWRYKFAITGTFAMLAVENIILVLEPYLLGRAIDGLIAQSYRALFIFVVLAATALIIGVLRRLYDTRVYGRIYREAACETIDKENAKQSPVSHISARAGFVKEFSEFFELYLPAALMSVFTLAGSIIMLGFISLRLFFVVAAAAIISGAVFYFSRNRIKYFNQHLNDELERQVEVLEARNRQHTRLHFSSIVSWQIKLSDLEARNFGLVFLLTIALSAIGVYFLIVVEDSSEGQVFSALTYILQFSQAIIILPYVYQQFIRTSEISARLQDPPNMTME